MYFRGSNHRLVETGSAGVGEADAEREDCLGFNGHPPRPLLADIERYNRIFDR